MQMFHVCIDGLALMCASDAASGLRESLNSDVNKAVERVEPSQKSSGEAGEAEIGASTTAKSAVDIGMARLWEVRVKALEERIVQKDHEVREMKKVHDKKQSFRWVVSAHRS